MLVASAEKSLAACSLLRRAGEGLLDRRGLAALEANGYVV